MTDNKIADPTRIAPIFVSVVVGSGTVNNVVNITFGTFMFTPNDNAIDPDLIVSCRLRMDLPCLHQLYEQIGNMLKSTTDEKPN